MSVALYYPWTHFRDDDWLKLALLSWSRIYRIRTDVIENHDSAVVREIEGATDLIHDMAPSQNDIDDATQTFREVLDLLSHEGRDDWVIDAPEDLLVSFREAERVFGDPRVDLFWLHDIKNVSGPTTLAEVMGMGGRRVVRSAQGLWTGMHPKLGRIYMAALVDAMARSNALSPVTDDADMHRAFGSLDRLAGTVADGGDPQAARRRVRGAYAHLAIEAVIRPKKISDVPVSRLIAFRTRHASELAAFRAHLGTLADDLQEISTVEDPSVLQHHLQDVYERTTKKHLDDLRRSLRSFGVDSTLGVLELKADMGTLSGLALGTAMATAGHTTVAAAALAVSLVPYSVRRLGDRRRQYLQSPVAYLLAAERKLR